MEETADTGIFRLVKKVEKAVGAKYNKEIHIKTQEDDSEDDIKGDNPEKVTLDYMGRELLRL